MRRIFTSEVHCSDYRDFTGMTSPVWSHEGIYRGRLESRLSVIFVSPFTLSVEPTGLDNLKVVSIVD